MVKATTILIKNPRVTEKSSMVAEQNIYTFDVVDNANKTEIKKAVFALYKVKPTKVNVVTVKEKQVRSRKGIKGTKSGGKKAIVYLKKGDKIELV
ncbi:MAG: 50S ribosomal protein L23 [Patescibacteria group bacterium]